MSWSERLARTSAFSPRWRATSPERCRSSSPQRFTSNGPELTPTCHDSLPIMPKHSPTRRCSDDAESYLDRAIALFRAQGQETELAGGLLTAAEIHLANGDIERSIGAAQDAASWFRKQGRDRWVAAATHLVLLAAAHAGDVSIELARSLDDVADALARTGLTVEATRTQLYAAKVRGDISATDGVDPVPPDVRRAARRGRSADQILLAHIDALVAGERHDSAAARRAISQGLRVAMSNQATSGRSRRGLMPRSTDTR